MKTIEVHNANMALTFLGYFNLDKKKFLLNCALHFNMSTDGLTLHVLALGLLLAVFGPGLGPDGPGCPENL